MTIEATQATAPAAITSAVVVSAPAPGTEPTVQELAALIPDAAPEVDLNGSTAAPGDERATATEAAADAVEKPVAAVAADPEADAALERATKAAAAARAGSRRYAAQQEELRQRAAEVQRAAREAAEARKEVAEARARAEEYKADPYKALKDGGMTDAQLAERAMKENTPEAAIERLERQNVQEREARANLEKRLAGEQQAAALRQAQAAFTSVADDEAAYPELAQLTAHAQLDRAQKAIDAIRANGHDPGLLTNEQIAEAAELWIKRERKAKATAKAAAVVAPAVAPAARPIAKTNGKTLTNADAQTRTVAPAEWHTLSEEQQIAHIAAGLPDAD